MNETQCPVCGSMVMWGKASKEKWKVFTELVDKTEVMLESGEPDSLLRVELDNLRAALVKAKEVLKGEK